MNTMFRRATDTAILITVFLSTLILSCNLLLPKNMFGAVYYGNKDRVLTLLNNGEDPNRVLKAKDCKPYLTWGFCDGDQVIHWAISQCQTEVLETLLQNGADPNAKMKETNRTPLMSVIRVNYNLDKNCGFKLEKEMIDLLLKYGADINLAQEHDSFGLFSGKKYRDYTTVLDDAIKEGNHQDIVEYLESKGAVRGKTIVTGQGVGLVEAVKTGAAIYKMAKRHSGETNSNKIWTCKTGCWGKTDSVATVTAMTKSEAISLFRKSLSGACASGIGLCCERCDPK